MPSSHGIYPLHRALREPGLLAQEWQRRKSQSHAPDDVEAQLKQVDLALKRLKAQEDRLVDAYKNEAIELPKLKEEMGKMKARREQLERGCIQLNPWP